MTYNVASRELGIAPLPNCFCQGGQAKREPSIVVATAAEAIRYAIEDLPALRSLGAWKQVGDERFNSDEIYGLYEGRDYPLRKSLGD